MTADQDGDEFHQIYSLARPAAGRSSGRTRRKSSTSSAARMVTGRKPARIRRERPRHRATWTSGCATRTATSATSSATRCTRSPPPGRRTAASCSSLDFRSNTDTSIHLVDVDSGESRELTPHEGEVNTCPGPFAPGRLGLLPALERRARVLGLALLPPGRGARMGRATPEGDIEELAMSEDGRVLGWVENDRGGRVVRLRDLESGADLPEPQLPDGAISPAGSAFTLSPERLPRRADLAGPAAAARPVRDRDRDREGAQADRKHARRPSTAPAGRARAHLLSDLRRTRDPGLALPAQAAQPNAGRPLDPRRPGVAGAARVHAALPVPAEPRDRRSRHQHPRLDRLRQDVPEAHPPRLGRWGRARLGSRREVAARAGLGRPRPHRGLGRVRTADSRSCPA